MTTGASRRVGTTLLGVVGLVGAAAVAVRLSPWPSALLIRAVFDRGAARTSAALEAHVPRSLSEVIDESYAADDPDARLDVFAPGGLQDGEARPTIVWIHGGAFISGAKGDIANYLRVLAGHGYTTVGVDYSISPEARYPRALEQVNRALGHVTRNATRLHVDPSRIVLAGDSAGSHLAAQVAALTTDPSYARLVGIPPSLAPEQLAGNLLFCGPYDFDLAKGSSRLGGWFLDTALWSYSGIKDHASDDRFQRASIAHHLSPDFPPTFLSAGNADPLLQHSLELADRLAELGVDHETLFFPAEHEPRLPHEYQFDLDSDAGRLALDRALAFLERLTATRARVVP
ncbi:esterase [Intrasporangium oryzae NRRL B-24470]|uniref:Esterase n=1 Tax=Intrasporangium oryzae NRRL B-24470 TaxID=1386089 RepID=W9G326_9MICO|nr:alpha/beta hydrolase [Intrasporangium oryzae]EWS99701.1 esterase [Intrasporangium oryzae NRRL B-24470]